MTYRRHLKIFALFAASLGLIAALASTPSANAMTSPASLAALQARIGSLPHPFRDWDVTLTRGVEPGSLNLSYNSPALGIRAVNSVYLPDAYLPTGPKPAVMYYLHGTVAPPLDNPMLTPVTDQESLLQMVGDGGGYIQTRLQDFPSQTDKAKFIVVAPDTDPHVTWCQTCAWADGKPGARTAPPLTAKTVPAETVLNRELMPLVEALFRTRADRGGRGIMGFSMGGLGALIQAFHHPDRFSYVGDISGPWDVVNDPFWGPWAEAVGYLRDQGYGSSVTNRIEYQNLNPKDMVSNFAGSGGHLTMSAGDACTQQDDPEDRADCTRYSPLRNPLAALLESQMRRSLDSSKPDLQQAGVRAEQFTQASGVHGANNHRVYARLIVPEANTVFASSVTHSATFTFKSARQSFSVWGYEVTKPDGPASFVELREARHDARSFTLAAEGRLTLTTPATFTPRQAYAVHFDITGAPTQTVVANADGRLTFTSPELPSRYGVQVTIRKA